MLIKRNADIITSKGIDSPNFVKRIFSDTQIFNSIKSVLAIYFSITFFKNVCNSNITFGK